MRQMLSLHSVYVDTGLTGTEISIDVGFALFQGSHDLAKTQYINWRGQSFHSETPRGSQHFSYFIMFFALYIGGMG